MYKVFFNYYGEEYLRLDKKTLQSIFHFRRTIKYLIQILSTSDRLNNKAQGHLAQAAFWMWAGYFRIISSTIFLGIFLNFGSHELRISKHFSSYMQMPLIRL